MISIYSYIQQIKVSNQKNNGPNENESIKQFIVDNTNVLEYHQNE